MGEGKCSPSFSMLDIGYATYLGNDSISQSINAKLCELGIGFVWGPSQVYTLVILEVSSDLSHDFFGELVLDFDTGLVLFLCFVVLASILVFPCLLQIGLSAPLAFSVGVCLEWASFSVHYQVDLANLKRLEELSASRYYVLCRHLNAVLVDDPSFNSFHVLLRDTVYTAMKPTRGIDSESLTPKISQRGLLGGKTQSLVEPLNSHGET